MTEKAHIQEIEKKKEIEKEKELQVIYFKKLCFVAFA